MKKLIISILFALFMVIRLYPQSKFSVNVAGSAAIGTGDFGELYGTGFGGTAALLYTTTPINDLTLSIGYDKWKNNNLTFTTIPLMIGMRYYYPLSGVILYIPGYLGLHFTTKETELPTAIIGNEIVGGNIISSSDTFFGFGIGFGVLIPIAPKLNIDINSTFNFFCTSNSNSNFIGINGGVQFGL